MIQIKLMCDNCGKQESLEPDTCNGFIEVDLEDYLGWVGIGALLFCSKDCLELVKANGVELYDDC